MPDPFSVLVPTKKTVLRDDVEERLRGAILQGHFRPGERLREEQLGAALGVSRGPVREALVELERQGLVVIYRNKGAVVAQLSREDLEELYTLRLAIEELAVRRTVQFVDEAALAKFDGVLEQMVNAIAGGVNESAAAELDLQLHDLIYTFANHGRLLDTWEMLRPQIHILLLSRNAGHADFQEMLLSSHQDIVGAIRQRDAEQAVDLLREHLSGSYERVALSLDAQIDKSSKVV